MLKRAMLKISEGFYILAFLAFSLVFLARCGLCKTEEGLPELVHYGACDSCTNNYDSGLGDIYTGGLSLNYAQGPLETFAIDEVACSSPELFCFISTLNSSNSEEHSVKSAESPFSSAPEVHKETGSSSSCSSNYGVVRLLNGRTSSHCLCSGEARHDISVMNKNHDESCLTSCTEHLVRQMDANFPSDKIFEIEGTQYAHSSSPHLVISPSWLDWGENYLYHPSVAFLTLKNTCNETDLNVYKSFSTDAQFYPCNSTEFVLGPGEVALLCFVFLPISLGLSSAEIIVQTSLGGFLLEAKGYSSDTPYQVSPLLEFDVFPTGWWSRNLSLFNPFEEIVHVEEVAVLTSTFVRNASLLAEATCRENNSFGYADTVTYDGRSSLHMRRGGLGFPVVAVRPVGNWLIGQRETKTVMDISLFTEMEAEVFGRICMRLHRPLENKTDILIVPVDSNINSKMSYRTTGDSVYASVEALGVYDSDAVASIALRNNASYLLRIIEISEVAEEENFLQIKCSEGLLLFPGTTTQVALVTYKPFRAEYDLLLTSTNCKLKILTNDSSSPLILIPCWDIVHNSSRQLRESSIKYKEQSGNRETRPKKEGSINSGKEHLDLSKKLKKEEAEESVLQNWRSHSTSSDLSVVNYHEVFFSRIPVGRHLSKLITVRNPSQQPVVMQLILNSGEIIHDCKSEDGYRRPASSSSFLSSDSSRPPIYGFSLAHGALIEAFVHPLGKASLGPILFHPSSRCSWKSSALIRNNLSGVEWVTLNGSGGLLSLVLHEGSKPVQSLVFNLNISSTSFQLNSEGVFYGCDKPLSKTLRVMNSGDMPATVRGISISGTECGSDGFVVQNCMGFTVESGEAKELVISYQTDLSAAMVQRDLELSLDTGILTIPVTATVPMHALQICQQSTSLFRWKKCVIFASSLVIFLFLCFFASHRLVSYLNDFISADYSTNIVRGDGKASLLHNQQEAGDFSTTTETNKLLESVGQDEESVMRSNVSCSAGKFIVSNLDTSAENCKPFRDSKNKTTTKSNAKMEIAAAIHQPSKNLATVISEVEVSQPCTDIIGPSEPVKLTVRTRADKIRRRRKRRGVGNGLIGLAEVSSSQSGNSTPSSPLSPVTPFTPKSIHPQPADSEEPIKSWTPFSFSSVVSLKDSGGDCSRPSELGKMNRRPVLLPSATFPGMGRAVPGMLCLSPSQPSDSIISPHARAPGSKLVNQKSVQVEEEHKFTYNIWDNHFSGFHLNSRSDEVSVTSPVAADNDSNSFFLRGPQAFVTNSRPRSVSYVHQGG